MEETIENALMIQKYKDVTVVNFQNASVLDSANIEAIGQNLLELVQKQDTKRIILDFSAVKFMSSQAIGVLIQLKKAMDAVKGVVVIVGIRPELFKVFKLTNLHKVFKFHDELDKALADFQIFIPKS